VLLYDLLQQMDEDLEKIDRFFLAQAVPEMEVWLVFDPTTFST